MPPHFVIPAKLHFSIEKVAKEFAVSAEMCIFVHEMKRSV